MIHNEVFLAAGYAVVLALIGRGFDWMAAQREREATDRQMAGADGAGGDAQRKGDPSLAHLQAARFQHGLALVVCCCAIYILFIVSLRHPDFSSIGLLGTAACAPGWIIVRAGQRSSRRSSKRVVTDRIPTPVDVGAPSLLCSTPFDRVTRKLLGYGAC